VCRLRLAPPFFFFVLPRAAQAPQILLRIGLETEAGEDKAHNVVHAHSIYRVSARIQVLFFYPEKQSPLVC
jgi:hypothetical protein